MFVQEDYQHRATIRIFSIFFEQILRYLSHHLHIKSLDDHLQYRLQFKDSHYRIKMMVEID